MKPLTIAIAALLLLLTACPKGGGGTSTTSASGTTTPPTATTPPPEPPVIVPAGTLAWNGWQLGTDWTDAEARLGSDVKLIEMWAEKPKLGEVTVRPQAGGEFPEQVLVFLDSQLVGYNFSDMLAVEQFGNLKSEITGQLGEPSPTPPAWAMDSPYLEGYRDPVKEVQFYYWGDEAARALMLIIYNNLTGLSVVTLANVDYFKLANERINTRLTQGAPPAAGAAGQAEAPEAETSSPVFGEVAVTTTCDFTLQGHKLGDTYAQVKGDCPDNGQLLISNMWAVELQTGMCGASPSDLSRPYPSFAAWFLNGALAGYIRNEEMSREEFIKATDEFDANYGAAVFDPPAWYLSTPDGKKYLVPDADTEQLIWPDEANQAILFAQYNFKEHVATFMMFDCYAYPVAQDKTMGSLGYEDKQEK